MQPSKSWKVSQKTLVLQVWIQPPGVTQNVEFGEHLRSQYQEGRHRRNPGDHWLTLQNQGVSLTYPVSENKVDDREMTPKVDFWSSWAWTFVPMGERTCACSCVHAHTHKHYAWMSTHIQEQTSEESWVVCTWRRFLRQDPLTQGRDKLKMRSRTIFHLPCQVSFHLVLITSSQAFMSVGSIPKDSTTHSLTVSNKSSCIPSALLWVLFLSLFPEQYGVTTTSWHLCGIRN